MLFFKTNKHTGVAREIPAYLQIQTPYQDFPLKMAGDYPRRVRQGELLFQCQEIPVVAPASGVAFLENNTEVRINVDGGFQETDPSSSVERIKNFPECLQDSGLISFDFPKLTLYNYFKNKPKKWNGRILLSPYSEYLPEAANALEVEKVKSNLLEFQEILKIWFPEAHLMNFYSGKKPLVGHIFGNPQYFLYKALGEIPQEEFPFSSIVYLGPETLNYLMKFIFNGAGFSSRIIDISFMNNSGKIQTLNQRITVSNGEDLSPILTKFQNEYNYFIPGSHFGHRPPAIEIGSPHFINIYTEREILLLKQSPEKFKEKDCCDCGACLEVCPMDNDPRLILQKNKTGFQAKQCVVCNFCSLVCPSGLDLMEYKKLL